MESMERSKELQRASGPAACVVRKSFLKTASASSRQPCALSPPMGRFPLSQDDICGRPWFFQSSSLHYVQSQSDCLSSPSQPQIYPLSSSLWLLDSSPLVLVKWWSQLAELRWSCLSPLHALLVLFLLEGFPCKCIFDGKVDSNNFWKQIRYKQVKLE